MIRVVIIFINLFIVLASWLNINVIDALWFTTFTKAHIRQCEKVEAPLIKLLKDEARHRPSQGNHPPVVKIIVPKSNSSFENNATVPYTITVSDPEDGESEYQEIASNEVYLEVKYVADAAKAAAFSKASVKSEPAGLTAIKGSNCFNCHTLNSKLIGPSFFDIRKRYPYTKSNTELLIKRIRQGSTGVWGTVSMPTHLELTPQQTQNIVQWIYKAAAQPGLDYYHGLDGSFRLKLPATATKGYFMVTASYTDHGTKDQPKQTFTGQDVILIRCRK